MFIRFSLSEVVFAIITCKSEQFSFGAVCDHLYCIQPYNNNTIQCLWSTSGLKCKKKSVSLELVVHKKGVKGHIIDCS